MLGSGFFTQLFNQFVSLLSAFCIVPSGGGGLPTAVKALDADPPPTIAVARDPVVSPDQFLLRVIQTQVRGAIKTGYTAAGIADNTTYVVLDTPSVLVNALNRNGLAGLPGGTADVAAAYVRLTERSAISVVDLLRSLALDQLSLLDGGGIKTYSGVELAAASIEPLAVKPKSYLERVIFTQVNGVTSVGLATLGLVNGVGESLITAPSLILRYTAAEGLAGLPAGIAAAGRQIVYAAADGSVRLIESVADFARAELALIPGSRGDAAMAFKADVPARPIGPVETLVRIPLAIGVAGADLTRSAMQATTYVTGAATAAVVNVVKAAKDPESGVTVAEAIAQAPATIKKGVDAAAEELRSGVERARTDFRETIRPRKADEVEYRSGTTLRVSGGAEIRSAATDGTKPDDGDGTNPNAGGNDGAGDPGTVVDQVQTVDTVTSGDPAPAAGGAEADADADAASEPAAA